jgi:N-methylhydantoinase A
VLADLRHDMVQTLNMMLEGLDTGALQRRMTAMGEQARAVIAATGIPMTEPSALYELDMHYLGQTHTLAVPLVVKQGNDARFGLTEDLVRQAFEAAYLSSFSRLLPGIAVRIVSLRVAAIGRRERFDFAAFAPKPSAPPRIGSRWV